MEDHGRPAGLIQVSDYDPAWPEMARRAIDEVSAALPGRLAATSVSSTPRAGCRWSAPWKNEVGQAAVHRALMSRQPGRQLVVGFGGRVG